MLSVSLSCEDTNPGFWKFSQGVGNQVLLLCMGLRASVAVRGMGGSTIDIPLLHHTSRYMGERER